MPMRTLTVFRVRDEPQPDAKDLVSTWVVRPIERRVHCHCKDLNGEPSKCSRGTAPGRRSRTDARVEWVRETTTRYSGPHWLRHVPIESLEDEIYGRVLDTKAQILRLCGLHGALAEQVWKEEPLFHKYRFDKKNNIEALPSIYEHDNVLYTIRGDRWAGSSTPCTALHHRAVHWRRKKGPSVRRVQREAP